METTKVLNMSSLGFHVPKHYIFRPAPYTLGIVLSVLYILLNIFVNLPLSSLFYQYLGDELFEMVIMMESILLAIISVALLVILILHLRNFDLEKVRKLFIVYIGALVIIHLVYYTNNYLTREQVFVLQTILSLVKLAFGGYLSYKLIVYKFDYVGGLVFVGVGLVVYVFISFITSLIYSYWLMVVADNIYTTMSFNLVFSLSRLLSIASTLLLCISFIYLYYIGNEYKDRIIKRYHHPEEKTFL